MPLFTKKYTSLEEQLIPMILTGVKTFRFRDEIIPSGGTRSILIPLTYPSVSIDHDGMKINCLASDYGSWLDEITLAFTELFAKNNIPLSFGAESYISVIKDQSSGNYEIKINVSLIDLDRLLEHNSVLYQASGNKNALYKKGHPLGINGDLSASLIKAINNTIFENPNEMVKYPTAYIVEPRKVFCLACDNTSSIDEGNAFYDFYLLFENLCKKHEIQLLPNATIYATRRIVKSNSSQIIKYEFNISPEDMENLLLLECPTYAGYREGASINRLVDPNNADIKKGVICVFPVLMVNDNEYMPRQAGCNLSELISVQLANYIKDYLLTDTNVRKQDFFGHHISSLVKEFLKIDSKDILDALAGCMNEANVSYKSYDGTKILSMSQAPYIKIQDLDETSIRIYQRHAVTTHIELQNLKSGEVPILDFLDVLIQQINKKIDRSKNRIKNPEQYTYIQHEKKYIKQAHESILKINILKTAIKEGPKITDIEDIVVKHKPKF